MHLEGALLRWRQHSQAQQEELSEHQRRPSIYPQGVVWGHCTPGEAREGETRSGFRDHHMGTACAAAPPWLPSMGFRQQGHSGDIWAHTERRMERAAGGSMPLPPQLSVCWCLGWLWAQILSLLAQHPGCSHSFELRHLKHCRGQSPSSWAMSLYSYVECMHLVPHMSSCVMG